MRIFKLTEKEAKNIAKTVFEFCEKIDGEDGWTRTEGRGWFIPSMVSRIKENPISAAFDCENIILNLMVLRKIAKDSPEWCEGIKIADFCGDELRNMTMFCKAERDAIRKGSLA